ncbi:MAG TPA: hypothetical protein VG389_27030 [Myxococcota bacterium]|jgi:hypothetical protein|nr:hypothetical protein [Myxococcota bacterium]
MRARLAFAPAPTRAPSLVLWLALCAGGAVAAGGGGCAPVEESRRPDEGVKDATKPADHAGKPTKKEAYEARWLDLVTRDKCAAGPVLLDRPLDIDLPPSPPGSVEMKVSFELCGPAGPSLPDAGRLRLVWSKGGATFAETTCDIPDIAGGHKKGAENPMPVTCPGNAVDLKAPGDYGLDIYLGDLLLRESRFQITSTESDGKKLLSVDKRLRYLEAWLGVRTDADGWPDRVGLEMRFPPASHDTVIYTWFRDGKIIRKAREAAAADFEGDRVWLEGPKVDNLYTKDGDYEVNVAVGGAEARTAFFTVRKGTIRVHPRQEETATRRVTDRYLLVECTVKGYAAGAEALPPATQATFGLWGKGW